MQSVRPLLSLASLAVFSTAATAGINDRYFFLVDSAQSQVQYEIDTNLGMCSLGTTQSGSISGEMQILLHPGAFPISDGRFDGGDCGCHPNLVGIIPNSLPGLPPLLEVHLDGLVVRPHSPTFQCNSTGNFMADANFDVVGGNLSVAVGGGVFVPVPILGMTSDNFRSQGHVWIDDNGIHVQREIGNVLDVNIPALSLDLHIAIRGLIRGNMGYAPPTYFCPATPNSTGQIARIFFGGTPSVSRDDAELFATECPPHVTGYFFTGDSQGQLPFGNGYRCVTGQLLRLGTIHCDANGAGSVALDLHAPPAAGNLVAGSTWNFQFAYRDVAAGGAMFNATGALAVDFVP